MWQNGSRGSKNVQNHPKSQALKNPIAKSKSHQKRQKPISNYQNVDSGYTNSIIKIDEIMKKVEEGSYFCKKNTMSNANSGFPEGDPTGGKAKWGAHRHWIWRVVAKVPHCWVAGRVRQLGDRSFVLASWSLACLSLQRAPARTIGF